MGFGQLVQRLPDGVAVAAEGQVVGGVASGGEEVWIRPFPKQQLDQLEVLLVDGEVQGAAAVTLLLRERKRFSSSGVSRVEPIQNGGCCCCCCGLPSSPRPLLDPPCSRPVRGSPEPMPGGGSSGLNRKKINRRRFRTKKFFTSQEQRSSQDDTTGKLLSQMTKIQKSCRVSM